LPRRAISSFSRVSIRFIAVSFDLARATQKVLASLAPHGGGGGSDGRAEDREADDYSPDRKSSSIRVRRAAVRAGFVVREGARLLGSVRLWSIAIDGAPALFLGPIAVVADNRKAGLGAELVEACLAHAAEAGLGVLLVGDAPYFGRFGFTAAPDVRLPGPVDPRRLLWRGEGQPRGAGTALSRPGRRLAGIVCWRCGTRRPGARR